MPREYLPSTDARLLAWLKNFATLLGEDPILYGTTAASAASFGQLVDSYETNLTKASDPITRTRAAVADKNDSRDRAKSSARLLASVVQGQPDVTPAMKINLGLTVRDVAPTPIPRPTFAPELTVTTVSGNAVTVRLADPRNPTHRGRPEGVAGATLLGHVGEVPPAQAGEWTYQFNTSAMEATVEFPVGTPPGSRVWVLAFFYNPRSQSGPAGMPAGAHTQFGAVTRAA